MDELFVYQYVCPFISMSVYSTTSLSVRQDLRFLSVRKPKHTGTKDFFLKEALSIKVWKIKCGVVVRKVPSARIVWACDKI